MHLLERLDIGEVARTFSNARIPATMEPQPKPPCCTKTEHYDTDAMGLLLQKASKTGVLNVTGRRGNVQCIRLCDYLGPSLQNTGVATVNYQLKSGTDVGRYSTRAGHQMFPSTIRAHLARQLYYDVDMKNAQPTLLLHLRSDCVSRLVNVSICACICRIVCTVAFLSISTPRACRRSTSRPRRRS